MNHSLLDALFVQSVQVSVMFFVALLGSFLCRRSSAHLRYWLWILVIAQCITPPILGLPIGVPGFVQSAWTTNPAKPSRNDQVIHKTSLPPLNNRTTSAVPIAITPQANPPGNSVQPTPPKTPRSYVSYVSSMDGIAIVWALMASLFLFHVAFQSWAIQRRLRRERVPVGPDCEMQLSCLASELGLRRPPRAFVAPSVNQPFVWGWIRGEIYLPTHFLAARNPHRQTAVLKHELAHIRRRDAAVNAAQLIIQALFFFHPLVWLANQRARHEREKCCDEMVLAGKNTDPQVYSEAIVEMLATGVSTRRSPSLAVTGAMRGIEDRLSTILHPNRIFHRGLSKATALVLILMATCVLPTVPVLQASPETKPMQASEDWSADQTVEVQVVHATTGRPLDKVKLALQCEGEGLDFQDVKIHTTDQDGQVSIPLPALPARSVRIYPSKVGFVPMRMYWSDVPTPRMPDSLTIPMQPSYRIGGRIINEDGIPIEQVQVKVHYWGSGSGELPHIRVNIDTQATTDAEGRWQLNVMPHDYAEKDLRIFVSHPDYVSDRLLRAIFPIPVTPQPEKRTLYEESSVMVMKKGKNVHGLVTDVDKNPIPNVKIYDQEYYWFGPHPPRAITDNRGFFKIKGVDWKDRSDVNYAGPYLLTLVADGYAPELITVDPDTLLHEVTMQKGKDLRGSIVDTEGRPIAGATISIDLWKDQNSRVDCSAKSDAQGRFKLTDAPANAVTYSVSKEGYLLAENVTLDRSVGDHKITLKTPITVSGKVLDQQTGELIQRCKVTLGIDPNDGRAVDWLPYFSKKVRSGRYELEIKQETFVYRVRVEADGYAPAISKLIRPYAPDIGRVVHDFQLRKSPPLSGQVSDQDGQPLPGADVYLATTRVNIKDRKMSYSGRNRSTKTDEQGKFSFPPEVESFYVVVVHPDGVAVVDELAFRESTQIQIRPWTSENQQLQLIRRPAPGQLSQLP